MSLSERSVSGTLEYACNKRILLYNSRGETATILGMLQHEAWARGTVPDTK